MDLHSIIISNRYLSLRIENCIGCNQFNYISSEIDYSYHVCNDNTYNLYYLNESLDQLLRENILTVKDYFYFKDQFAIDGGLDFLQNIM
jgi:hypothetical protein